MNNKETAYLQRVFFPFFRHVKVIKIHQDFSELRLQTYCRLFMVHSVYATTGNLMTWIIST